MPVLFERTRPTKQQLRAVFAHIRRRREKEKAEEEAKRAKEEEEKRKKEEEARKRKEELDDVAKQIEALEEKLKSLKKEKRELFAQLKKDLLQKQEDENRKRTQFSTTLYNPTGTHIPGAKGFGAPNSGGPGSVVLFPGTSAVSEDYQAPPGNAKHPISPASHNIASLGASGLPNTVGQTQQQSGRYQGYSAQYVTHQQGQSSALHMQNEGHYAAVRHPVTGLGTATDVSTSQPHQTGSYHPEARATSHGSSGQEQFGRPQVQPGGQQGQGGNQGVKHDPDQTLHRQSSQNAGSYANQGQNQGPNQPTEQSHPPYGRSLSKTSGQQQGYGAQHVQGQQHGSSHSQSYHGAQQGASQQGQQLQREYHGQQYSHGPHGSHMSQEGKPHQAHGQEHTAYHPPAQSDKQLQQPLQLQSSLHMQQTYSGLHSQPQNFSSEQQRQVPQTQNYQSQPGYQVQQDQVAHQQKYQQIQQPYPHSSQQRSQQQGTPCQGRQSQYDQKLHPQTAPGPTTPLSGKKQESTHGGQPQGQPPTYSSQYLTQQDYGDQHQSQGAHSSKRPSHRYNPYSGYQGSKGHYQGTSKKFSGKYSQGPSQEEPSQGSCYTGGSSHGQQRHHHQNRGHKSDGAGSYSTPSAQQRSSRYYS